MVVLTRLSSMTVSATLTCAGAGVAVDDDGGGGTCSGGGCGGATSGSNWRLAADGW